jgi:hypothetical protein
LKCPPSHILKEYPEITDADIYYLKKYGARKMTKQVEIAMEGLRRTLGR